MKTNTLLSICLVAMIILFWMSQCQVDSAHKRFEKLRMECDTISDLRESNGFLEGRLYEDSLNKGLKPSIPVGVKYLPK